MELIRKYWIPVINILESSFTITIAHPKYIKAIYVKKTDKKGAKWIVDFSNIIWSPKALCLPYQVNSCTTWCVYRFKLTNFTSSEKNRLQNSLRCPISILKMWYSIRSTEAIWTLIDAPPIHLLILIHFSTASWKGKLPELELAVKGLWSPN